MKTAYPRSMVRREAELLDNGIIVRLRNDPSRTGEVTGARRFAGADYVLVRLSDGSGTQNFPVDQIERVEGVPDCLADLGHGKFSAPEDFRRLLIHTRLTGNLSDVIYSMEATNTDFHAYQFKPVVKLLNSPSGGLLIADEVGLGKTIEAGLIWTELVARLDASRLLVVCPKSLSEKWKFELRSKFSLTARITDARGLLQALKDESESSEGFALICSLPSLRPPRSWETESPKNGSRIGLAHYLQEHAEENPLFNLAIFDEAHHLRNSETAQHELARMILQLAEHRLLLSATPINLRSEDLRSLLRLLDPDTFNNQFVFAQMEAENEPLVAARERVLNRSIGLAATIEDIRRIPRGSILRTDRRMEILGEVLSAARQDDATTRVAIAAQLEEMSLLGSIVNRTRRRDVNDVRVKRVAEVHKWKLTPLEREFYEEASDIVRGHAREIPASERFLLATPQRLIASSLPAAFDHWARHLGGTSTDDPDAKEIKAGPMVMKLALLCQDESRRAALEAGDSKYRLLVDVLHQNWTQDRAEKLIVFSSFRRTIDYLDRRLRADGIRTEKLHGSIKEDRQDVLDRFAVGSGPLVLLTSEIGGEGLDLQFCRTMVNFDLPWNPMKVEQRIGRIDRIGQKAEKVEILNLICEDTIEAQVYHRLYERIRLIERTLGGFEAILGEELGGLEGRILDPKLTDAERAAMIEEAAIIIERRHRMQEELEEEAAGLIAHGDMILRRIYENYREDRRITSEELRDYLQSAVEGRYPGSRLTRAPGNENSFTLKLSASAHLDFKQFRDVSARRYPTRLMKESSALVVFGKMQPDLPRAEAVGPVHPLIRFASRLRDEAGINAPLSPAVHVRLSKRHLSLALSAGTYLCAAQLWSTRGIVENDRIAFSAAHAGGTLLTDNEAEQVCRRSLEFGTMIGGTSADTLAAWAAEIRHKLLEGDLGPRMEMFVREARARHEDRAETERAQIERHLERRTMVDQARIDEWIASGEANKLRIVPAAQARLDKFVAIMEQKLSNARRREDFSFAPERTLGVVVVELSD